MSDPRDPLLADELAAFGGESIKACHECENCAAECPLSSDATRHLRKAIQRLQSSEGGTLAGSAEPWLTCYCGECSTACPREANPGELMTAMRRYLTARYDWTGLSRKLFLSPVWQLGVTLAVAAMVVTLFALSGAFTKERMVSTHVSLQTFIPAEKVQYANWILASILLFLLLTNALRMHRFIVGAHKDLIIPRLLYLMELKALFSGFLGQLRRGAMENRRRWIKHILLLLTCSAMIVLVLVFLRAFQRDTSGFHLTSLVGYFATIVFFYYCAETTLGWLRKNVTPRERPHAMDWALVVQLSLTGVTGVLVNVFRLLDLPHPTYLTYVIHLAFAVSLLLVQIPFGSWAGLLYRPLASYLVRVTCRAREFGFYRAA